MNTNSNGKYIREFKNFLKTDVVPALDELEKIENDKSRIHIQKLIYTNITDRFDYTIDNTLVASLLDNENLRADVFSKLNSPMNESDLIKILLSEDIQENIKIRLEHIMRTSILKERHSFKLKKLMQAYEIADKKLNSPRVNPSTGHITDQYKVQKQNDKIPSSILGYSDYLYSRRNTLVHGGGSSRLLQNDINQLKKIYSVSPAQTVKISLSSIKTASNFYSDLFDLVEDQFSKKY